MNFAALCIRRPVATVLLTLAVTLIGAVAFVSLPIASLPQVDMPVINVQATLPGANAETMAATVATPLERAIGRIAGITELTSTSNQGNTRVSVQFDFGRNADAAAREVQAAISAAQGVLPVSLPSAPVYRKANIASSPVLAIALTSDFRSREQLYDVAFTLLGQKIAQVPGVGQINVNGSALPAVRVAVNPTALSHYGVGLEQVRAALAAANVNQPKGVVESAQQQWQIDINDRARRAADYRDLIISWHNGAPVRLADIADVNDSLQELRNAGSSNGQPAVMLSVFNQPGANIVEMVDAIKALLPQLRGAIPADIDVVVNMDRTSTIRATLREVEHTLLISIALVILVVYLFLRSGRATFIPSVAIPVSLLGTLAVIYLLGYSLNNLSLMALIIATGFVVDDAIVVVENTARLIERGVAPTVAALQSLREVGFTVVAMSLALVAVLLPVLLMEGIIGRLLREFSVTLCIAVLISLVVSLTTTPMLCAQLLRPHRQSGTQRAGRMAALGDRIIRGYGTSLLWALRHRWLMLGLLALVVLLNIYLIAVLPKGFFPQQDTSRLQGNFMADQAISFQAMRGKIDQLMRIVAKDPAIETYYEYTGGAGAGQNNSGQMFARLKPRDQRDASAAEVVARLRPQLSKVAGATLMLNAQQDINVGGRPGAALYQYSLLASDLDELRQWAPRLLEALRKLPQLTDVSSDWQERGLQTVLKVDRAAAARLGISAAKIDATLNDAFGQRLVSTIYEPLNQYYVVLTLRPEFTRDPQALRHIHVANEAGATIPLASFSRYEERSAPLAVNHQGQFAAATVSFNLADGVTLGEASMAIDNAFLTLATPGSVRGGFAGTAQVFQQSLRNQPLLILAALITAYIVLGILYESFLHPLTILSTLPSAGVGALLALALFGSELSVIALIGILLLIGIVMKNAIMLIDFALDARREHKETRREHKETRREHVEERREHKENERSEHTNERHEHGADALSAIHQAGLMRFRPIMMTTMAAILGALPLALALGDGSELRRPLGITIVGGLLVSQLLTLYTTPVIYLHLDNLQCNLAAWRQRFRLPGAAV